MFKDETSPHLITPNQNPGNQIILDIFRETAQCSPALLRNGGYKEGPRNLCFVRHPIPLLALQRMNCFAIFQLFGVYGDVFRAGPLDGWGPQPPPLPVPPVRGWESELERRSKSFGAGPALVPTLRRCEVGPLLRSVALPARFDLWHQTPVVPPPTPPEAG